MSKPFNANQMKQHAAASPLVKLILQTLAHRERPRPTTDLRRLRHEIQAATGTRYDVKEFTDAMSLFQKAGAGVLVASKAPEDPERFRWSVDYIDMACDVLNIPLRHSVRQSAAHLALAMGAPAPEQRKPTSAFPLSTGGFIHIPLDITEDDAEDLAKFVRRLVAGRRATVAAAR